MLEERGLLSMPESIRRRRAGDCHRLPDRFLTDLWGVRPIIEDRILDNQGDRDIPRPRAGVRGYRAGAHSAPTAREAA